MSKNQGVKVLVTGANGFVASHIVLQLLEAGYQVRGTARSKEREQSFRHSLIKHAHNLENLELVAVDLAYDAGWDAAVDGCKYVIHVASPFPLKLPEHEDDVIIPARDGTLRVLNAAAKQGVSRVVMTSSIAAILYGKKRDQVFDERSWADITSDKIGAYQKSKVIAEQAAWDFMRGGSAGNLTLTVINPGLVLGPVLGENCGTSGELIRKFLGREIPAIPNMGWACVDVRDVAAAHISAMITPEAAGERFICAIEHASMRKIAEVLNERFGDRYKISLRRAPDFLVRLMALFDDDIKITLNDLGVRQDLDNTKIKRVLNWHPKTLEEMVVAMAQSLIEKGVV